MEPVGSRLVRREVVDSSETEGARMEGARRPQVVEHDAAQCVHPTQEVWRFQAGTEEIGGSRLRLRSWLQCRVGTTHYPLPGFFGFFGGFFNEKTQCGFFTKDILLKTMIFKPQN